ncbi:MAG: endonuclease III domain-containing protein, partial [Candidatus Heimdallarchaeota archaeon]
VRKILSQNSTDKNSLRAYANLIETFKTWDELLEADETEIAEPIRSGGLANIKAKKIKKSLMEIKKREGKIDLEFLADYKQEEAEDYLMSLDGVGPKTAACVLIFSFNFPIMPVDTHVHRLSNRIG